MTEPGSCQVIRCLVLCCFHHAGLYTKLFSRFLVGVHVKMLISSVQSREPEEGLRNVYFNKGCSQSPKWLVQGPMLKKPGLHLNTAPRKFFICYLIAACRPTSNWQVLTKLYWFSMLTCWGIASKQILSWQIASAAHI